MNSPLEPRRGDVQSVAATFSAAGATKGIEADVPTGYVLSMSIVTRPRTKEEVDEMIASVKETTKELMRDKKKGRAFLIKRGYITKTGKLTKRYGG